MDFSFIDKYDMLPSGALVLCAVSGGADSVYLLLRLLELSEERGLKICAAHFNHCLRGAEADRDEKFVRELCGKLGVELEVGRGDVSALAGERGMGTEEAARTLRYEFLERAAEKFDADRIATAHNANDNAETVLLNLARGTGLRGLCGIPPRRGRLIRPLLTVSRDEIDEYLASRGVGHVEDSTNAHDDYARNRVRHLAVPALLGVNGGFFANTLRASELLRADEEYLTGQARKFLDENLRGGLVPARALAELPEVLAARAVRLAAGRALSEKHVDAVLALARGEGRGYADVAGMRVTREQGFLRFGGEEPREIAEREIKPGSVIGIPEAKARIKCDFCEKNPEVYSSLNTFFFNYENICGTIFCTSARAGDKVRIAGRNCTKKLSDMFTERKMTRAQRLSTPVLRDEQGIIAVYGFGTAERCAAERGARALRIDIIVGESI